MRLLDWNRPAIDLERLVRAYNPVPGAWFMLDEQRIKCWQVRHTAADDAPPGTVVCSGTGRDRRIAVVMARCG